MSRISDFGERIKTLVVSWVLIDDNPGGMKEKIINNLNCKTEGEECKENDLTDDAIIKKVSENDTLKKALCVNHELSNVTHGKKMAEVVSAQNDSIKAIAKNDTQVNEFLHQEDFRKAVIKNILKNGNYRKEFIKDKEFHNAAVEFLKENSNDALKMYLKANPTSVILQKLLILSPMIIAWISSLICIASMCGCCYPFGLSEPSSSQSKVTASKSNDKKGKKSADKKEKKKNAK
uniref:Uncharacterized protein n=1 Tax=Panagrolaimus sp. PS1159 TaxID=55785 RepID=A0AC35GFF3_9BILA